MKHKMQEFRAKIYKVGINPAVDVPSRITETFHKSGYIPVTGKINTEIPFNSTLCPTGGGNYRLYINGEMRKQVGVNVGKRILVQLAYDSAVRELPLPNVLRRALTNSPKAQVRFDNLVPARRREVLAYLSSLKTKTALERNVKKFISKLTSSRIKVDSAK